MRRIGTNPAKQIITIANIQSMKRALIVLAFVFGMTLANSVSAEEEHSTRIRFSAEAIEKGYTVRAPEDAMMVGVWPGVLNFPVTVEVKYVPPTSYPMPDNMTLVSDIWVYDVLKADITIKDPIVLSKPVSFALKYNSANLYRKRIFFWNSIDERWDPLPSKMYPDEKTVRGWFVLPYAPLAVFEDTNAVEGKSSWFRHSLADTAASNDFPIGSRLRITSLENGNSVEVVVRSTGPFVPGRVVDIERRAFEMLKPAWQGVGWVRVELISS